MIRGPIRSPIAGALRAPLSAAVVPADEMDVAGVFFSAGEQGGWYDASDLSTLFQDAAGTVPVTAAGQAVKRWSDKSGRGNHVTNTSANWTYEVDASGNPYVLATGSFNLRTAATVAWGAGTVTCVAATQTLSVFGSQDAIVGFGNAGSTQGAWSVEIYNGGPLTYYRGSGGFAGRGSANVGSASTVFSTAVNLGGTTHATENSVHRVNGVSPITTNYGSADSGGGNFGTQYLAIGGGGASTDWNGRFYQVIVTAKAATIDEIKQAETFCASKIGLSVPSIRASDPVWLDTFAPVDEGAFVRTSPFSRAAYATTAEKVIIKGYSNIASTFSSFDQIAVYVNGTYHSALNPSADGAFEQLLSLSSGYKTIEVFSGLQSSPSQSPSAVIGSWFTGADASAVMTAVSETPANRLVIYGDSIAVGGNSTIPPKDAWPVLLRAERGSDSTMVEAYGYRSLHLDASDSTKRAAFVAKIQALNPSILWIAIGTNDYGLTKWTDTQFGTAYGAFLDDIHAVMPSLVIYCQTPILRSGEPTANGNGLFLSQFRTAISTAVSSRSAWATLVDGTAILTTGDLADGVHPTTAGHAAYAAYVAGVLGV